MGGDPAVSRLSSRRVARVSRRNRFGALRRFLAGEGPTTPGLPTRVVGRSRHPLKLSRQCPQPSSQLVARAAHRYATVHAVAWQAPRGLGEGLEVAAMGAGNDSEVIVLQSSGSVTVTS